MGQYLGISVDKYPELAWVRRFAAVAPLPAPWIAIRDSTGDICFAHPRTKYVSTVHPLDGTMLALAKSQQGAVKAYRRERKALKEKLATAKSKLVKARKESKLQRKTKAKARDQSPTAEASDAGSEGSQDEAPPGDVELRRKVRRAQARVTKLEARLADKDLAAADVQRHLSEGLGVVAVKSASQAAAADACGGSRPPGDTSAPEVADAAGAAALVSEEALELLSMADLRFIDQLCT